MPTLGVHRTIWRLAGTGRTAVQLALIAGMLAACGGGGGGGGGDGGGGGSGTNPPPGGGFTLNVSSLTFVAKFGGPPALPQSILATLSDMTSAAIGAGYAPGVVPPPWLTVTASGSNLQYSFQFFANTTALAPGTYTATVAIGTSNSSGAILQSRDVQVTYTIRDGVRITSPPPILSAVAGSSESSQTFQLNVEAPASLQWSASASQAWVLPPAGTHTGPGNYTVNIDTSTLPPGRSTATLTLTNVADSTDNATLLVTVDSSAPILTTSLTAIVLGGDSGLEISPVPLAFALGTGTNAYPWTLTATTTTGGNWLTLGSNAGTVASSNVTVDVDADRSQLAAGTYTGQLELRATVNSVAVTRTLPVTLNVAANRLLVSAAGIAFSSFPSRQVLTRSLAVRNTLDAPAVPWQATTSAPWLTATLSGNTGEPLVVTADATGLAVGEYSTTVSVVSSSAAITNTETIRVGLTVGASDPVLVDIPTVRGLAVVASPVEPEVFVTNFVNGNVINVEAYDVYSGALLRTLPATGGLPQSLAISADGQSLYVAEDVASGDRIVELDPVTGDVRQTFLLANNIGFPTLNMAYARPDTHPVLLTTVQGEIFDAVTGTLFNARVDGGHSIDVSADQRYVYTLNSGFSPATIYRYELRYSDLTAGGLSSTRLVTQNSLTEAYPRSNGRDVAVAPSGSTVYVASGSPYEFEELAPETLLRTNVLAALAFPNNVETCWNGLVAGGADASSEPLGDIWVYDSADTLVARLDSSTGENSNLVAQALKFSGDCTRLVSASGAGLRIQDAP